jgi:P4 family phage/plasmid primase-like protien
MVNPNKPSKPSALTHQRLLVGILADEIFAAGLFFSNSTSVFYSYQADKGYFKLLELFEVERLFLEILLYKFPKENITDGKVVSLVKLAQKYCRDFKPESERYIAFKDTLLSLDDFTTTVEPSIDRVAVLYFDYNLEDVLNAHAPRWMQFLEEVFVSTDEDGVVFTPDQSLILLFQSVCGFFLSQPTKSRPYATFLVGGGANGKSKICNIIDAIFTDQYVSSSKLQSLTTDKFAPAQLIGKRVNICSEEEEKFLSSGAFKAITGGDKIEGQHKFGRTFSFRCNTRLLITSNDMPTFTGLNDGLKRRMVIIPMLRQFRGSNDDTNLEEKLKAELPGILNWMLQGAQFFISENYKLPVEKTPAAMQALNEFEMEVSSAMRFVKEKYTPCAEDDPDSEWENIQEVYNIYKIWCDDVGKRPMNKIQFGRDVAPYLGKSKVKRIENKLIRVYYFKTNKIV